LHLLETRLKAMQLSPYHADPPARRSLRLDTIAGFLACYFPLFTFRLLGQPSDPETSPLVPARYAGDTTLRLVAQLQRPPATSSATTSPATTRSSRPEPGLPADQAPTGSRRADQRVRACRLTSQVSAGGRLLEPHRAAWTAARRAKGSRSVSIESIMTEADRPVNAWRIVQSQPFHCDEGSYNKAQGLRT